MNITSRLATAFAMTLVLAGAALAQDEPADREKPAEETPAEADDSSSNQVADHQLRPIVGVRYRVKLSSGREVIGVVRARGVFEHYVGRDGYEPCGQDDKGAGIRIWFVSNQDGFIFLSLDDVKEIEELGALTAEEGRELARLRMEAEKRADEARRRLERLRAAERAAEAERRANERSGAGGGESADGGADDVDAAELADLLVRYPPTQWTLETPKEIERRRVILGLFPSDEEKAFLEIFDKWKIAYEVWKSAQEERQENS